MRFFLLQEQLERTVAELKQRIDELTVELENTYVFMGLWINAISFVISILTFAVNESCAVRLRNCRKWSICTKRQWNKKRLWLVKIRNCKVKRAECGNLATWLLIKFNQSKTNNFARFINLLLKIWLNQFNFLPSNYCPTIVQTTCTKPKRHWLMPIANCTNLTWR